jgi:hypothetical protein
MDALIGWAHEHIRHDVAALLLVARLGDIGTTWLATPTLVLEANPVVKKLGWWFAGPTLLLCLLPYYSLPFALVALMGSLLVSASNASKVWMMRAVGEHEYRAFLVGVARRSRLGRALGSVYAAAGFVTLTGLSVLLFYPTADEWGFYIGAGIVVYAMAMAFHGTVFVVRLFREAGTGTPWTTSPSSSNID